MSSTHWPAAPSPPGPPDPEPLPLDTLPPTLANQVRSVAGATQTPADMAALLALAAVSAALRGRAEVEVDARGWVELVTVYCVAVLPPATRKSAVFRHMVAPLEAGERDALADTGPERRRALDRLDVARDALGHVRRQAARGRATRTDLETARAEVDAAEAAVPPEARLLAGDATPEALVAKMADTGGPIALLAPEGDPLALADGRYSDTARVDELLRCYDGETMRVDRRGRDPLVVERPALTLGVTCQPAALEALRHRAVFRGRGLLGRILWVQPDHGLGRRLTGRAVPPLDVGADERYARTIRALLDASWSAPVQRLTLAAEAREVVHGFEAEVEVELADGGRLAAVRDAAGKVAGQAVRVAALLELAARAEDGRPMWSAPIGRWAMAGGVRFARAALTHAVAVLAPALDDATADAQYVLRRVRELPEESTVRDVYMAVRGRPSIAQPERPTEYLAELLDILVQGGCVRLVPRPSTGGRPPSPTVELHPSLRPAGSSATLERAEVVL